MNRCAADSKRPQTPNQNNTPSKTSRHHNGENKTSHDKNKFKQHSTANAALQKVIKRNAKFMKLIISLKTQRVNNRRTPKSKEVMYGPISMCVVCALTIATTINDKIKKESAVIGHQYSSISMISNP